MKKIIYNIMLITIILIIIVQQNLSIAVTKTELNNEQKDLDEQIQKAEDELDGIQSEKSETLKQAENLTIEISGYEAQIEELDEKITSLNKQIAQAEKDIKSEEEEYARQQEALEERLITIYENGDTSYLDFLLSSKSITDFISNYFLVSELVTYDTELLEQIEETKKKIEEKKASLESNKAELDKTKSSKQTVVTDLKKSKAQKENYIQQLTEEEKQTQKELEAFEEDKRKITAELRRIAEEEERERKRLAEEARKKAEEEAKNEKDKNNSTSNSSSGSYITDVITTPSASGYIFPVSGCSKASIRVKTYPSYKGHTGVDVNIGVVGKKVVAVKDGTVIKSEAKKIGGIYYSYGEFVTISHGDGTMTLYGHMLENSRRVQPGEKVKQGQVIGTVGSTGNSTGPHLHFEVRVGTLATPVNPLPYLP